MTACCCLCAFAGQQGMLQACQQPLASCRTDFALQARALRQQLQACPVAQCCSASSEGLCRSETVSHLPCLLCSQVCAVRAQSWSWPTSLDGLLAITLFQVLLLCSQGCASQGATQAYQWPLCEAWLSTKALMPAVVQSEVCSLGAIPALVKLLREGGSRGQTAAAWALKVLAAATETSRYLV